MVALAPAFLSGCSGCPGLPTGPPPELPRMTESITIRPRSSPRPTLGDDPSTDPSEFERLALDAYNRGRQVRNRPPARYDVVLGDAARSHARILLDHGEAASEAAVDPLLGWAGAADPHPQRHVLITTGGDETELLAHLERLGGGDSHELGELAIGVGRRDKLGRTVLMTIVSDRVFHLATTQRQAPVGEAVALKGRLSPGFSGATLLFLADGGRIHEVPPTERGLSSRGENVTFRFAPPLRGQMLVEILLTGPRGPTVGALFPLSVGEAPPDQFTISPPPDESSIRSAQEAEQRLFDLINRERVDRRVPALVRSAAGDGAARRFAQASLESGILAHQGPDGGKVTDRLASVGIAAARASENLARNGSVEDAHRSLMRSLGHRKNILDPELDHVGVGVATSPPVIDGVDERDYWIVCEFFRSVPVVEPARDGRSLRAALNVRRAEARLPPLAAHDDLDLLAAKLAGQVLRTHNDDPARLAPKVRQAISLSGDRWSGAWSMQVYRVALPLDEATDADAALRPDYTHVGVGLAQPTLRLQPDDVRTAVVLLFASWR